MPQRFSMGAQSKRLNLLLFFTVALLQGIGASRAKTEGLKKIVAAVANVWQLVLHLPFATSGS